MTVNTEPSGLRTLDAVPPVPGAAEDDGTQLAVGTDAAAGDSAAAASAAGGRGGTEEGALVHSAHHARREAAGNGPVVADGARLR